VVQLKLGELRDIKHITIIRTIKSFDRSSTVIVSSL
jgi:hypothetical protein